MSGVRTELLTEDALKGVGSCAVTPEDSTNGASGENRQEQETWITLVQNYFSILICKVLNGVEHFNSVYCNFRTCVSEIQNTYTSHLAILCTV